MNLLANSRTAISNGWTRAIQTWSAWLHWPLIAGWTTLAVILALRLHASFNTFTYDLGYFTQVIWNTSQGRLFQTTLLPRMALRDHFAPLLALFAPIFWIVPDAAVLNVFFVISLGLSVIPAYLLLRDHHPMLAPLLVLAFVFNPVTHQLAGWEFHETAMAVPLITTAAYALHRDKMKLMVAALGLTLLVREEMPVYVASFGLFLALFRPKRRWLGLALIVGAIAATMIILFVFRPFSAIEVLESGRTSGQSSIFNMLGEIPARIQGSLARRGRADALFLLFASLAFLPLLARGEQLLWTPMVIILLILSRTYNGELFGYRAAPFIPLLWVAIASSLSKLPKRWAYSGMAILLAATAVTYALRSPFPGGKFYDPSKYEITEHDRIGHQVIAQIPPDASLAAHNTLGVHLAARRSILMFPWYRPDEPPEMIVLDAATRYPFPLTEAETHVAVDEFLLDPNFEIFWEQDQYYVFRTSRVTPLPDQGPWVWSDMLQLDGYELAQAVGTEPFSADPLHLSDGGTLRVSLYWTALKAMNKDYTISVRLIAPDGFLIVQDDAPPGRGLLPTSAWASDQHIRDVHYLSLPEGRNPEKVRVDIVIYQLETLERLAPVDGYTIATIEPK